MICGSLNQRSANHALLDVAKQALLSLDGVEVGPIVMLDDIPIFRPNQVDQPPKAVARLRSFTESADGLLLAAPEYAGGLAGGTKNALDWLVGSASIYHRPTAVASAGTTGGVFAIEQLVRTLSWQGALVVATLGISAPITKTDGDGSFVEEATLSGIAGWAQSVVDANTDSSKELLRTVTNTVTPFGIDADRFGDLGRG